VLFRRKQRGRVVSEESRARDRSHSVFIIRAASLAGLESVLESARTDEGRRFFALIARNPAR